MDPTTTEPVSAPPFSGDPVKDIHARWEIGHLAELARSGSLVAGRELIRRVIARYEQQPDQLDPALCDWLKDFLGKVVRNPRQSVGQLIAPREKHLRPQSHAELVHDLSLSQETYVRVRRSVETGAPLKTACEASTLSVASSESRTS
jgi:hypothetical protein